MEEDHSACSKGPVIPLASETDVFGKLKRLSSAEDFFAGLGVPYDPALLSVARL
ncbi:nitrogenase-stabilizing/protective protein NifW, partial [Acinetobacter baumannii]